MTSDEELGLSPGMLDIVKSAAAVDLPGVAKGALSLLGVETNYSLMQRAVAQDYEAWLLDTVLGLLKDSKDSRSDQARSSWRIDEVEERQRHLNQLIEEFEHRLRGLDARVSDLMALVSAGYEVWHLNAEPGKREYLARFLSRAFSPSHYKSGLVGECIAILSSINVRQVKLLQSLAKADNETSGLLSPFELDHIDYLKLTTVNLVYSLQGKFKLTELGRKWNLLLSRAADAHVE